MHRKRLLDFLQGMGSVLNVWPAPPERRPIRPSRLARIDPRISSWGKLCLDGAAVAHDLKNAAAKILGQGREAQV